MTENQDYRPYLIILGAGPQQEKIYTLALKLGHRIIGIDLDVNAIAKKYCDMFLNISIKNDIEMIRQLRISGLKFSGVVTCGAEVSPQVSNIAETFGLIGIPYEVAVNTTDKFRRSSVLKAGGIKIPRFQILNDENEINLSYPVVVKPVDSSGSRGVTLVREKIHIAKAINLAKKMSTSGEVLCEEFIEQGIEVSIEAFVVDGIPHVTGIAERHFLDIDKTFPEFIEYGGTMPPTFSAELIEECNRVFKSAIIALKVPGGPSKGDLIIRNGEVYVLEITSRSSPGFAAEMQPLNSGIEPLDVLLKWATGQKFDIEALTPKFNRGAAHRYFLHEPGVVSEIRGLDILHKSKDVKYHLMLSAPLVGDVLEPMSYMNRLFYIMTDGETNLEAISKAESVLGKILIRTK